MNIDLSKLTKSVKFEDYKFTSNEISQIAQSKKVLGLSFYNCPINDNDILQISTLPKLVNLVLENTSITDKSLEYLSKLPNLKYLFITKAKITGKGFKYFENNKKIDCIWACSTYLNDENLKLIAKIPKLGTLRILDTLVTFDGLLSVANNPRLHIVANDIFSKEQIELFEQEQRKLSKKTTTIITETASAKNTLEAFFNAIAEWEKHVNNIGFNEDLSIKCKEIFQLFCVDKIRLGYRPEVLYFAGSPNYSYKLEKLVDEEQISKNKIQLFTKDNNNFKYKYVLIQTVDAKWKIDERYIQSGNWKKCGL